MIDVKSLKSIDRQILQALIQSEGKLHGFTLSRRYQLPPHEIGNAISKLQEKQIIESDGVTLSLTKMGREWIIKSRFELFSREVKLWRECPEDFKQERLEINKPYIPRIHKLDKSLTIRRKRGT